MSPLESAARELCACDERDGGQPWEYYSVMDQARYTVRAKAVLLAVREPTDEMLQPGCAKHTPGQPMQEGYPECPSFVRRRKVWASMIDVLTAQPDHHGGG